ncbi:1456_t:CDS:2, partial [Gigaspora rosea]
MDDSNDCIGNIYIDDPHPIDDNIYMDNSSIEVDNSHEDSYVNEPDNLETAQDILLLSKSAKWGPTGYCSYELGIGVKIDQELKLNEQNIEHFIISNS